MCLFMPHLLSVQIIYCTMAISLAIQLYEFCYRVCKLLLTEIT